MSHQSHSLFNDIGDDMFEKFNLNEDMHGDFAFGFDQHHPGHHGSIDTTNAGEAYYQHGKPDEDDLLNMLDDHIPQDPYATAATHATAHHAAIGYGGQQHDLYQHPGMPPLGTYSQQHKMQHTIDLGAPFQQMPMGFHSVPMGPPAPVHRGLDMQTESKSPDNKSPKRSVGRPPKSPKNDSLAMGPPPPPPSPPGGVTLGVLPASIPANMMPPTDRTSSLSATIGGVAKISLKPIPGLDPMEQASLALQAAQAAAAAAGLDSNGNPIIPAGEKPRRRIKLTPEQREARRNMRLTQRRLRKSAREKERRSLENDYFIELANLVGLPPDARDKASILEAVISAIQDEQGEDMTEEEMAENVAGIYAAFGIDPPSREAQAASKAERSSQAVIKKEADAQAKADDKQPSPEPRPVAF